MSSNRATIADSGCLKTKLTLLWMNLSSEPLIAIFSLIPFMLRQQLGSSGFQLALFSMLSPVLAVFSFYWGAQLTYRRNALLPNLISAWILARIPFLFFPFFKSFWPFFGACAIYHLFSRASTPALMEILRRTIPDFKRQRLFSLYYLISALEGSLLGLIFYKIIVINESNWTIVFFAAGLIGLSSVFFQMRLSIPTDASDKVAPPNPITYPLKEAFQLLRRRPDFARFQWAFMFGGASLMMINPVKSIYFADHLALSAAQLTLARTLFIGLGIAGSSLVWQNFLDKFGIQTLTYWILILFAFFPLMIFGSSFHITLFYLAHLLYGIAQGGSHLVWHLSGPIFAGNEDSSLYTTVNILMVGLRGAIAPLLGGLLCDILGPLPILLLGASIAAYGAYHMKRKTIYSSAQGLS
jgi:MFS family permease